MFKLFNWQIYLYAAAATFVIATGSFFIGHHKGVQQCNEARDAIANKAAIAQMAADSEAIATQAAKSTDAGVALAKQAQSIETRTQYLIKEVIKNVPIKNEFGSDCNIDAHGVRAWNAANRGDDVVPAAAP